MSVPFIQRRHNAGTVDLGGDQLMSSCIDVRMPSGDYERLEFYGYITSKGAHTIPDARRVRLRIYRMRHPETREWTYLRDDQHLLGCRVGRGVFVVVWRGEVTIV